MSKIAFVTDSNSGITQKQGEALGIYVLPMPFDINGKTYFEDISLSHQEFYTMLGENQSIFTSQPSPEDVLTLWKKALKEYDEVVHIPMSSGLSGSCQSAHMLSLEFDGRVQVVNNQRVSVTQRQSVLDGLMLAEHGYSAGEIKDFLEKDKANSSIYIMLDTLYYLKKGGRITPAAAAIGSLLRLKPVLQIQGEKLDAFAKARTSSQGKALMINAVKNDITSRFDAMDPDKICLQIAYSDNQKTAAQLKEEVIAAFPGYDIHVDPLSLSIACHIGPGALAVACCKKNIL